MLILMTDEITNLDNSDEGQGDTENGLGTTSRMPAKAPHPMEVLLKQSGGVPSLKAGDIVEGIVISRKGSRLFLDLGPRGGLGIVFGREYYAAQEVIKALNIGDTVSAKVVELDNEEGYIELSLKEAGEERRWIELKNCMESGELVEIPVREANRGGLILELKGVEGFLPASQLSSQHYPRVEGGDKEKIYVELQKLVGTPLKVKVLDVNPAEGKLIFTEKETDEKAAHEVLSKYKIGDIVEGEITGVVDFGAFMRFDESGLEGLIHISEIDWTLIESPKAVLKPGDKVKAKIIDIQGDKVSLSLKALKEDPWLKVAEKYKKGDTIRGKATKYNPYGVFVELEANGIQGLLHISEFGTEAKMREEIGLGKEYEFKILLIDAKEHRMSLGMIRGEKEEREASPEPMPSESA